MPDRNSESLRHRDGRGNQHCGTTFPAPYNTVMSRLAEYRAPISLGVEHDNSEARKLRYPKHVPCIT